jgi:hypothetical protein
MKLLAISLGCQKALHSHLTKLANYANQVAGYRLSGNDSQVIGYSHSTEKLLAIPLGYQKTIAKWLVISNPKAIAKCLVMMWFFYHASQNTH